MKRVFQVRQLSWVFAVLLLLLIGGTLWQSTSLGLFESQDDVGSVQLAGSVDFEDTENVYHIYGSGDDMESNRDACHYIYKKVNADFVMDTELNWSGHGVNAHREGGILLRENLNPGARYVSAVLHGDGLTAMHYRVSPDSMALEQSACISQPPVLHLEKRGSMVCMMAGLSEDNLTTIGTIEMPFESKEFYLGLFVCSHHPEVVEEGVFSHTALQLADAEARPYL